jgi:hypothetical protein
VFEAGEEEVVDVCEPVVGKVEFVEIQKGEFFNLFDPVVGEI